MPEWEELKLFLWDCQFELMEAEGQVTNESFLVMVWRSKWAE